MEEITKSDLPIEERECKACGNIIPQARIEAKPDAEYCVKCAEKYGPPDIKAQWKPDPYGHRPRHW